MARAGAAAAAPELIVTVGGLALRRLLGITALTDAIGKSFVLGDAIVIPLPHPSGASGWLNEPQNRARLGKAATHVRRELARLERSKLRVMADAAAIRKPRASTSRRPRGRSPRRRCARPG